MARSPLLCPCQVSLASYTDVELDKVECHKITYEYAPLPWPRGMLSSPPLMPRGRYSCCPNDPYPVIKYRVYVRREPGYFIVWTVVPTTIFTLLSFTVFFMSFQVGRAHHVGCNLLMAVTS